MPSHLASLFHEQFIEPAYARPFFPRIFPHCCFHHLFIVCFCRCFHCLRLIRCFCLRCFDFCCCPPLRRYYVSFFLCSRGFLRRCFSCFLSSFRLSSFLSFLSSILVGFLVVISFVIFVLIINYLLVFFFIGSAFSFLFAFLCCRSVVSLVSVNYYPCCSFCYVR